jgi:energy-coupling factor transporter ATP-binding protein EcfA2
MFAETVYDDIAYGPRNFGYGGEQLLEIVKKSFDMVGLDFDRFKNRSPHTLSGGEARLAAIAGGLATQKDIIIMDEPTEELDYNGTKIVKATIAKMAATGKTVLLISHDSDLLFEMCDYLILWSEMAVDMNKKSDFYDKPESFENTRVEIPEILKFAERMDLTREFKALGLDAIDDLRSII